MDARNFIKLQYKDANYRVCVPHVNMTLMALKEGRREIERFARKFPTFYTSLEPINLDVPISEDSHQVVGEMLRASKIAGTGPMAAVAGALAEYMARSVLGDPAVEAGTADITEAIVENGGDIFMVLQRPAVIGIYSGKGTAHRLGNQNSKGIGFSINPENTPLAICSSSSKMGHSKSFGRCDLAVVVSGNASIADAVATALCNRIVRKTDLEPAMDWACQCNEVDGCLVVFDEKIGMAGTLPPFVSTKGADVSMKISRHPEGGFV